MPWPSCLARSRRSASARAMLESVVPVEGDASSGKEAEGSSADSSPPGASSGLFTPNSCLLSVCSGEYRQLSSVPSGENRQFTGCVSPGYGYCATASWVIAISILNSLPPSFFPLSIIIKPPKQQRKQAN